jgi:DNA-binding LacI/PurR family transcriptional regulator
MLARIPDCTAIFAANDHVALGIMRAMAEQGRRIPDDVSLVGFDDVPEAGYFHPGLSTVRQEFAEVGRQAVRLLLDRLATGVNTAESALVEPVLIPRATVAPPETKEKRT